MGTSDLCDVHHQPPVREHRLEHKPELDPVEVGAFVE